MAYSDFSLARVKNDFGLTLDESRDLFVATAAVAPSEILTTILKDYVSLAIAISTEKARSEFLIATILAEVRRLLNKRVSLFFGKDFTVDPARGLQGFCEYTAYFMYMWYTQSSSKKGASLIDSRYFFGI